ncbi:MAG: hypothetical protein AB8I08_26065 [Sandaracinaceae bacterium]
MSARRALWLPVLCASLWGASGCDPLPTQILVHVNAEPELLRRTDRLRIRVWGRAPNESSFDEDAFQFETAPTEPGDITWPWLVDLRPQAGDPSRVWRIEAAAYQGAPPDPESVDISPNLLAVARTSASYAEGQIQHVYLLLYDACIDGEPCLDPDSTCAVTGRCEPIGEPGFFNPEAGTPDAGRSMDAGRLDAGRECETRPEECNDMDDDCDGRVDEDFDLETDITRCGSCTTACDAPNGTPSCVAGECRYACFDDYRNCDENPDCETRRGPAHCLGCGMACSDPTPTCSGETCVGACEPPEVECDGRCTNIEDNPEHCGGCGVVCDTRPNATATCGGGGCDYTCNANFDDCDDDLNNDQGTSSNGCESDLREPEHCADCGVQCRSDDCTFAVCNAGMCEEMNADGIDCSIGSCEGTCSSGACDAFCEPDAGPPVDGGMDAGMDPCAGCSDECCSGVCCAAGQYCDSADACAFPEDAGPDADAGCGVCAEDCCGAECCAADEWCDAGTCVPVDGGIGTVDAGFDDADVAEVDASIPVEPGV